MWKIIQEFNSLNCTYVAGQNLSGLVIIWLTYWRSTIVDAHVLHVFCIYKKGLVTGDREQGK